METYLYRNLFGCTWKYTRQKAHTATKRTVYSKNQKRYNAAAAAAVVAAAAVAAMPTPA